MASKAVDIKSLRNRKLPERGRCPVCGRRQINRLSRHHQPSNDWEVQNLEQLVETMEAGEVAGLLGISRWELEKRCQSLGIHWRGSEREEEE